MHPATTPACESRPRSGPQDPSRAARLGRAAASFTSIPLWLSIGCGGPFFLIPGGELAGTVVDRPISDWTFVDDSFVDLETRPDDPYSVELNYFVRGGLLYIDAAEGRGWQQHLHDDNRVRVRFSSEVYPLQAQRVGMPGELSGFDPERMVYRLDARSGSAGRGADEVPDFIAAALSHPDRPAADRESDASRKPARVLTLAGVQPGMRVADLMAGGGWYTEVLARSVGPEGHVVAQNNATSAKHYAAALEQRVASSRLDNTRLMTRELEELSLPAEQLDAVFMAQFYHDTYWMGVDRAAMNRQIFAALRPGGVFCLIDHRASEGAGDRDTRSLHRGDPVMIRTEIEEAGFLLVTQANFLANPADDRSRSVFDPEIRGRTDRFVLLFRKPATRDAD